ncbi:protegrin-2-like [Monodelphis domestica]|uniref:protegrin-2-like n=1 Tax=Monodelphis domestica TaxID=13616 RepID=UPI0004431985|nr:protegrin-2-like [Monodelphis domestica]
MERGQIMWLLLLLMLVTPLASTQTLTYQDLVNRFIINYNKKSNSRNLFRLLALNLQPGANNDPAIPRPLNFTIMETVCPNTKQRQLVECDFKKHGLVKVCFGIISLDATQPSIDISCEEPGQIMNDGFWYQLIRTFGNLIHQKYRKLLEAYRKLRDIFSG